MKEQKRFFTYHSYPSFSWSLDARLVNDIIQVLGCLGIQKVGFQLVETWIRHGKPVLLSYVFPNYDKKENFQKIIAMQSFQTSKSEHFSIFYRWYTLLYNLHLVITIIVSHKYKRSCESMENFKGRPRSSIRDMTSGWW